MSNTGLPVSVEPIKFAEQQLELEGIIPFGRFTRIGESIRSHEGDAKAKLSFRKDEQRRIVVSGSVEVDLVLECQRCLGDLPLKVVSDINLVIVFTDEQAKNLPRECDPYLLDGYDLNIADMVEEELLLALPAFGYHEAGECKLDYEAEAEDESADRQKPEKSNPFSVLSELKVKK